MSSSDPRLAQNLADLPQSQAEAPLRRGAVLDLVRLARQSLGDKDREVELLGLFAAQAGLLGARLPAVSGPDGAAAASLARMLHGSARAVGAEALAQACEAYLVALGTSGEGAARASLLCEIDAVCGTISDLLAR